MRGEGYTRLAREAQLRQDWDGALKLWDACLRDFPDDSARSSWRSARSLVLIELGRYAAAEAEFRALARDRPDLPSGFSGLARVAHSQENWTQALERWRDCLKRFPFDPSATGWRNSAGAALLQLGQLSEAEEVFAELARDLPDSPAGPSGLARVAQAHQDWRQAVERWDACISRFPSDPRLKPNWRAARAAALEKLGAWQEAYRAWDALAEDSSATANVRVGRVRCLLEWLGPTAEAERSAAAVLDAFPTNSAAFDLHARIAAYRGDDQTALARYLSWLEALPHEIEPYQLAMETLLRVADARGAAALVAKAPREIIDSIAFHCRVKLPYFMLHAQIGPGLNIIDGLDCEALDRPSAAMVVSFLNYAMRFEQLLDFSRRMVEHFPRGPVFINNYLVAVYRVQGKDAFEREKARLLSPLSDRETAMVLSGFPPAWLAHAEAKRVVDRWSTAWDPGLKTQRLLQMASRGDAEILAYIAKRLETGGSETDRFLAQLLLANARDRQRIDSANLEGSQWADFRATRETIDHDIEVLLAKAGKCSNLPAPVVDAVAAAYRLAATCKTAWIHSGDCYFDAASFAAWLADRIGRAEPTAVLRLNDGEGAFLPHPLADREFQAVDRRIFQQIWWGEERIPAHLIQSLMEQFDRSISRADAIGLPTPKRLIRDLGKSVVAHSRRGLASVVAYLAMLPAEILHEKILTSSIVHSDLDQWDLYRQVFAPTSRVSVVSCHDLARPLAERFGLAVRCWFRIAPEYKFADMFVDSTCTASKPFYPDVFNQIMQSVAPLPGEVFLVAAGFLGKLICGRIRERGGIAIDIGSVADTWLGYATRSALGGELDFDPSSTLIEEQPFRDYFSPQGISLAEPCRSDRARHRNLAGAFDRLFQNGTAPDQRSYAVRVIGHPRCGGAYVAQILSRLGLNIGHLQPGAHGLSSWIHTVDDLNPPFGVVPVPARAFRSTLAFVRDPASALPSIMIENCRNASFAFRRFHIARQFGVDIAKRRTALERAVASYLLWMEMVDAQRPLATLRVEHLLKDLAANADALSPTGLDRDWTESDAAAASQGNTCAAHKPLIAVAQYRALPADLSEGLAAFCARYGYPIPG